MAFVEDLQAVFPKADPFNGERIEIVTWAQAVPSLQVICRNSGVHFSHRESMDDLILMDKTFDTDPDYFKEGIAPGDSAVFLRYRADGSPKLAYIIERLGPNEAYGHYLVGEQVGSPVVRQALWDLGIRTVGSKVEKDNSLIDRVILPGTTTLGETGDGKFLNLSMTMNARP